MSKIIDISKFNTINNWNDVEKNVDGIIIRVGYRGYSSGKIVKDEKFNANVRGCISHNIPFGFYFMLGAFLLSCALGIIFERQRDIWGCTILHWACGYLAMCLFF